jgi:hypothetical protein
VVSPGDWFVSSIFSIYTQGKLKMESEVSLPVCAGWSELLFSPGAAALPISCNSAWSAPPPARCGNSVLNTAICVTGSAPGSTTCPASGGCLLPHPCAQLLCLSQPLLSASSSSGRLVCHPTPTLSLCCFSPCSPGQVQCSTPTSTVGIRSQFSLCFSVLLRGEVSLPRGCTALCSQRVGRGVTCGA